MPKILFCVAVCLSLGCGPSGREEASPALSLPHQNIPGKQVLFVSDDGGNSWAHRGDGIAEDAFLTDLSASGGKIVLSTKQHGLFQYDPDGIRWMSLPAKPGNLDVDAILLRDNQIFAGTHGEGVMQSDDMGKTWRPVSLGLTSLVIRDLAFITGKLFAATNDGLFQYAGESWERKFGEVNLQVNAVVNHGNMPLLATNHGAFLQTENGWKEILKDRSLHNISSVDETIFAMTYGELFLSTDHGNNWQSDQQGLPGGLYTFQVIGGEAGSLAGQWDGIYRKLPGIGWARIRATIPDKFAVTELLIHQNTIFAASSGWTD